MIPAKGVIRIAMVFKMMEAVKCLLNRGYMPCRHPPHDKAQSLIRIVPFALAVIELLVNGVEGEGVQAFDVFPDGQRACRARIAPQRAVRIKLRGLHIVAFQMPDIARAAARDVIDTVEIVQEVHDAWVFPVIFKGADVEFSEVHEPVSLPLQNSGDRLATQTALIPKDMRMIILVYLDSNFAKAIRRQQ